MLIKLTTPPHTHTCTLEYSELVGCYNHSYSELVISSICLPLNFYNHLLSFFIDGNNVSDPKKIYIYPLQTIAGTTTIQLKRNWKLCTSLQPRKKKPHCLWSHTELVLVTNAAPHLKSGNKDWSCLMVWGFKRIFACGTVCSNWWLWLLLLLIYFHSFLCIHMYIYICQCALFMFPQSGFCVTKRLFRREVALINKYLTYWGYKSLNWVLPEAFELSWHNLLLYS